MKKFQFNLLLISFFLVFASCSDSTSTTERPDENPPEPDSGQADFSVFISIGNSLTAGMMDASLYNESQHYSLGAMLARQLEADAFNQPDINAENGYNSLFSTNEQIFGRLKLDTSSDPMVPSPTISGDPITDFTGNRAALHNFGVNGINVNDLLTPNTAIPGTAAYNRYYERFASAPGSSTILGDAIAAQPTFFSLWIGNNDILRYITSGKQNPAALTEPSAFQRDFSDVISSLMNQTEAKGVVATIPQILEVPLLTAIPYNIVELDELTAAFLNIALAEYNDVLDLLIEHLDMDADDINRRKVFYQAGANPVFMTDPGLESLAGPFDQLFENGLISENQRETLRYYEQARPMENHPETGPERLMMTAFLVLGTPGESNPQAPVGVAEPLPANYTFSSEDMIEIEERRLALNQIIRSEIEAANSDSVRLALYNTDAQNSAFADIFGISDGEPGISVQSEFLEANFGVNGVFSTDGVHPNAKGNGVIVNEFIDAIEETFGAVIPKVTIAELPGVAVCEGDCLSNQAKAVPFVIHQRIQATLNAAPVSIH